MAEKKPKNSRQLFNAPPALWLKKAEELRVILDSVPAMVFYKDKKNNFIRTNKAFEEAMGIPKKKLEGKNLFSIYPKKQAKAFWKDDKEVIHFGKPKRGIVELMQTKKGGRLVQTDKIPYTNERGEVAGVIGFAVDITESKKREEDLDQTNRTLQAHKHSEQALMRATNEADYLDEVCKIIVEDCGYAMVWIGYAKTDKKKSVQPAAYSGFEKGYLESLKITWANTDYGRGPTGSAIRLGKPSLCRDMLADPKFRPWRKEAIKRGYASSIALPLIFRGQTLGAITIYSKKTNAFSEDEIKLLTDLANDLSYGITALRSRVKHTLTDDALRESEAKLKQERQLMDALIENTVANLAFLDQGFNFIWVNRQYARAFGKKPADLIAKNYFSIKEHKKYRPTFQAALDTGKPVEFKAEPFTLLRQPDKATTYWDWTLVPIKTPLAKISGLVLSKIDVTKTKRAEEEKNNFIAMLAHEMRNPLAPLLAATQILRDCPEPLPHNPGKIILEETLLKQAVEISEKQIKTLSRLLDDLLDVSRIVRGKIRLQKENINLNEIINNAIVTVSSVAQSRPSLNVDLPPKPLLIKADPLRIEQIIINLLNNAFKYTPPGRKVWITAKKERNEAVVSIRDQGIGIAEENLSAIFELFFQTNQTRANFQAGLGIGLMLARKLAQLHGGDIAAKSGGIGKGSEFIARLPASKTAPKAKIAPEIENPKTVTKKRILLVDDNKDITQLLSKLLHFYGYDVKTASTGELALEIAKKYNPEVVLLDIGLPGMDGYETARRLRKQRPKSGPKMVIVATTGYGQEDDRRNSKKAGFDFHLVKPVDIKSLITLMAKN